MTTGKGHSVRPPVADSPKSYHQGQGALPLVGQSTPMRHLRSLIETISHRTCTVVIQGESGTGKEMVARQIHAAGPRAGDPFVPVDCATLRDTLAESQLFGHVKGAFTGAEQPTIGFFRAAAGGTLFLDEIAELEPGIQAKLLRCIQEGAVVPLGGVKPIPANVRIIAASHRDLSKMVQHDEFREDLYYRLDVVHLEVPPLRARRGDIALLANHFLARLAEIYDEPLKTLSEDAMIALEAYDWPGNVRELANAIEHAYTLTAGHRLTAADLPERVRTSASKPARGDRGAILPLDEAERSLIARALQAAGGRQAQAARLLHIDRRRLYRKVRRYNLQNLTRSPHH